MARHRESFYDYDKLKELVTNGLTIDNALKDMGVSRATFYRYATKEEKAELKLLKSSNKGRFEEDNLYDFN